MGLTESVLLATDLHAGVVEAQPPGVQDVVVVVEIVDIQDHLVAARAAEASYSRH